MEQFWAIKENENNKGNYCIKRRTDNIDIQIPNKRGKIITRKKEELEYGNRGKKHIFTIGLWMNVFQDWKQWMATENYERNLKKNARSIISCLDLGRWWW